MWEQAAFDAALVSPPVLNYPYLHSFILTTNASDMGLGGLFFPQEKHHRRIC